MYNIGDVIEYKTFCGPRIVKVTERHADVKNGRPGFSGSNEHGNYWGYDYQFTKVVEPSERR
jgi:hypothetical protein